MICFRFPDYGKATEAAKNIFDLLNRKPKIDNESIDGDKIVCKHKRSYSSPLIYSVFIQMNFNGQIDFNHVYFHYPTRPESKVLKSFKLHIKPGIDT